MVEVLEEKKTNGEDSVLNKAMEVEMLEKFLQAESSPPKKNFC